MAWIIVKGKSWQVRWRDEKRRTQTRTFHTEEEAQAWKTEVEAQHRDRHWKDDVRRQAQRGEITATQAAFMLGGEYTPDAEDPKYALASYVRTMVQGDRMLRATTRALYLRIVRVWLDDSPIGAADVRYLSPEDIDAWWSTLPHDEKPGAINNVVQLLRSALRRAVRKGLRDDNPLDRTDVRKVRRKSRGVTPLTTEQVEALAAAAATPRDRLEVLLMAYGGLRAGEVGGLRVEDIDWAKSQVHIEQQVVRVSGQGLEVSDLKTDAARRVVTLPRSVTEELRSYVGDRREGLVFTGARGGMRDSVRINDSVQTAAKKAGLTTHAHALRHTAVSMWVADGASPLDVQRMVGHSDIKMTLGQYGHLFSHGGEDLARRMEKRREAHRNGS